MAKLKSNPQPQEFVYPQPPSRNLMIVVGVVIALMIISTLAAAFYFYQQYQNILNNPQSVTETSTKALVNEVGKLIKLPDESPTIATVSDKQKLSSQPFFANAENGDKVLIFSAAKKAILYRPSQHLIIEVAPINLGENLQETTK